MPNSASPQRVILWFSAIVLAAVFAASADPMPAPPLLPTPQAYIHFAGGDGSTCHRAVVVAGASHETEGVRAQRWWIFTKRVGARIVDQTLSHDDGRDFETLNILTAEGTRQAICFDITSFFGKP